MYLAIGETISLLTLSLGPYCKTYQMDKGGAAERQSRRVHRTADISAEYASASAAVVKFATPGAFSDAASACTTAPTVSALPSRRREFCHSAAHPSTFSRGFNSDGERASAE